MRKGLLFSVVFCIAQLLVPYAKTGDQANALKPVEISQDAHFRLLMENTRVRVWIVELQPNEKTSLVYRGHDFLQIPVMEGSLSTSIEGRQPIPFWVEKKARFVRGGFAQVVQNTTKILARIVEIEFIKGIGVERCGPEAQVSCGCLGASVGIVRVFSCGVLETDDVAVNQLENHGGDKLGFSVVPTLAVAIDSVRVQSAASSAETGSTLEPGEVVWVDKAGEEIQSLDQRSTARAVTVEFKNSSAALSP